MKARTKIQEDAPRQEWRNRSVLAIAPGLWKMRNGHVAKVTHQKILSYESCGKKKPFPIWIGRCEQCGDALTWNANGTYSPVAKHPFDLMKAA